MKVNKFWLPLGGFLVLAVVLAVALTRAPDKGQAFVKSALIGKPAPAFELPSLTEPGAVVRNTDFAGGWYLLNVWGTWCVECRVEHPLLLDIAREGRVKIVGLDYKDEDAAALAWLQELGNPYAAIAADREGRAAINWGVYGAPETFLVDPQGVIVHKQVGVVTPQAWKDEFLPRIEGTLK